MPLLRAGMCSGRSPRRLYLIESRRAFYAAAVMLLAPDRQGAGHLALHYAVLYTGLAPLAAQVGRGCYWPS